MYHYLVQYFLMAWDIPLWWPCTELVTSAGLLWL